MVQFVYTKRSISPFFIMVMAFVMSSFGITNKSNAQSLACSNQIQLSLGTECADTILPSLFLTTPVAAGDTAKYWIEIKDELGVVVATGNFFNSGMVTAKDTAIIRSTGTFSVTVHFDSDGVDTDGRESDNSCWGTLLVEFKLNLDGIITTVCGVGNDSCMYNCFYLDDIFDDLTFTGMLNLNPDFTGVEDSITCVTFDEDDIIFRDELVGDICNDLRVRRTWFVPDLATNAHSPNADFVITRQEFLIKNDTLSRVLPPVTNIEIACGIDRDPQSIFDHLISRKTNPLSIDSALMSAFPFIVDTLLGFADTGAVGNMKVRLDSLVHFDTLKIALKPGVLNSSKTHQSCNLAVSYADQTEIPICGRGYKVLRHWTIIDWCTKQDTSFIQLIDATGSGSISMDMKTDTFQINTDPWFCKANLVMDLPLINAACSDDYWITIKSDKLDLDVTVASSELEMKVTNLPPGNHELILELQDDCNNKTKDTIYVFVVDRVSPVAVAKEQVVATLLSGGTENCIAKVRANSIDNNSYDACSDDNVKLEVKRYEAPDSEYGPHVELTGDDLTDIDSRGIAYGIVKVSLRVWDDGNGDGTPGTPGDNFNIAWTNLRIEDKNTDVYADCGPIQIEVNCDDSMGNLIDMYRPTAFRAGCISEELEVEGWIVADDRDDLCNTGGVRVRYSAGGKVLCDKTFWFMDLDAFDINESVFPDDVFNGKCTDQDFGDFDFSNIDLACNLIGTSIEEEVFEFESGISCLKILRHFTIIDWCEHDANQSTFYQEENGVNVGYYHIPGVDTLTGFPDTVVTVLTNRRNGIWKHTQVVKISDGTKPELTGCDLLQEISADVDCEAVVVLTNSAVDNIENGICPSGNLTWTAAADADGDGVFETPAVVTGMNNVQAVLPGTWSVGIYQVKWTVTDVCGNMDMCVSEFLVKDDKAPTPVCIQALSTAVMNQGESITIWASDFMASIPSDPCSSNVEYSFSELTPDEKNKTIRCADINNGISQIFEFNIYAHDESGNVGWCIAQIKVDDNADVCQDIVSGNAAIAGSIFTAEGDDIESAKVLVNSLNEGSFYNSETSVTGEYAFEGMPMHFSYKVNSEKNDDYLNGVSTLDLVLIQKHILGLDLLPTAYKVIAADINSDERISAIDLVELRKLVLGIYAELPQNNSWRFVDADETFIDALSPWPFTESLDLTLDQNVSGMDFVGVKIGDVSGNAIANSLIAQGRNTNNEVVLNAIDSDVSTGDQFVLRVSANDILDVSGIQIGMEFNGAVLTDVASDAITLTANDYFANESSLNLSWIDANGISLDGEILSLSFTATTDGLISEMVQFSNSYRSEIYTGSGLDVNDVKLAFSGASESVVGTEFELYQNKPNPFNATTDITFLIGANGPATLNVFDITGKMIYEVTETYTKGLNTVSLDKGQLNASGVLYYQLNFEGNIATRKMISID